MVLMAFVGEPQGLYSPFRGQGNFRPPKLSQAGFQLVTIRTTEIINAGMLSPFSEEEFVGRIYGNYSVNHTQISGGARFSAVYESCPDMARALLDSRYIRPHS
jgi:hypothetical protein